MLPFCRHFRLRRFASGAVILALTCQLSALASAQTEAKETTNSPSSTELLRPQEFDATVQDQQSTASESVRCILMSANQRHMRFVLPEEFRADLRNPEKITLANESFTALLSVRVLAATEDSPAPGSAAAYRTWISSRWADPVILNEHTFSAAKNSGPAFDLLCKVDRVVRKVQIGFVPTPAGILEFSAVCSPEQFESAKSALYVLMRGFQMSGLDGKLPLVVYHSES